MIVALQMIAVVALIHGIYYAIKRDVSKLGHFARKFARWMMLVVGVLYGLFIAGETFAEPGGSNAALLTAAWVVPLIVITLLAWRMPKVAQPILYVYFVLAIVANVISFVFPDNYREFFNTQGPWLGIGGFVFTIAATVWGYHNNKIVAGVMNIVLALLPMLGVLQMAEPAALLGAGSSAALMTPGFIAGVLLILSDQLDHESIG